MEMLGSVFADLYRGPLRANTVIENLDKVDYTDSDIRHPKRSSKQKHVSFALCHFDIVRGWAQPYDWTSGNDHPGCGHRTKL